jgi:uncharacterized RDD family membrane protein YckC
MDSAQRPGVIASFWTRLLADLIDTVMLAMVGLILGLGFGSHLGGPGGPGRLIGFPITVAYLGLAGNRLGGGQTAGKSLVGLRVVGADGEPIGVGKALLRASVVSAPWFFNGVQFPYEMPLARPLTVLAGTLVFGVVPASIMLFFASRRRQFLHDVLARSFVVVGEQQPLPASGPPRWALAVAAVWIVGWTVQSVVLVARATQPLDDPLFSALRSVPRVASAGVSAMEVSPMGGERYRALYVWVATGLGGEGPEQVVRQSAAAVVAFYPELNQFRAIRVENRTGFDVGLASWSTGTIETRTPEEWRRLVEPEVNELLRGRAR